MLGETTGISAGGQDEEGKFLRVPGTNPFFPRDMADMGNRMLELLHSRDLPAFVLNTGRVGGTDGATAKKLTIPYSSAMVEAIVSGAIEWVTDEDFGYEIAASVPGIDDIEVLQPRRLYERQAPGRIRGHGEPDQAGATRVPELVRGSGRRDRQGDRLRAGRLAAGRS